MKLMRNPAILRVVMNLWPPYLGAGIRVRSIAGDWSRAEVTMPLRWYNRNYVGTHFGGSLFAMADPFYMLLIMNRLGRDYRIWDKAAAIEFLKPARGTVNAVFGVSDELILHLREETAAGAPHTEELFVDIRDTHGETVARVSKTVHVRKHKLPDSVG